MSNYHKLILWQKADELAFLIYEASKGFPKHEMFGITSQLRRAALSVPTNIVEGYSRRGRKEYKYFINIALGSINETEYLFGFCHKLGYVAEDCSRINGLIDEVKRLLYSFYLNL